MLLPLLFVPTGYVVTPSKEVQRDKEFVPTQEGVPAESKTFGVEGGITTQLREVLGIGAISVFSFFLALGIFLYLRRRMV